MGLMSSQLPLKTMVPLCRQLSTAFSAGIPITQSLSLVSEQTRDRRARTVLTDMADAIRDGSTLSEATRGQRKYVPDFFIELLAAGEVGGRLDVMLKDMADYFEDRLEMRRKVLRSLSYPMFQLAAAWFLGTFALGLVRGLDFSKGSDFLSGYFARYAAFQMASLGTFAVGFGVCIVLSRLGLFQWVSGWFTTFIWPVSLVTRRFALARFFRSMSLLIGSGLHIVDCIVRSANVVGNPYIVRDLLKAAPFVKEGASLSEAFAGTQCLTRMAREMLVVGEQSGNLEGALHKVADYHLSEATHAVGVTASVLNVLIVCVVGLVIGYVVVSFWTQFYGGMMDGLGI